jgi:hypothetical protein
MNPMLQPSAASAGTTPRAARSHSCSVSRRWFKATAPLPQNCEKNYLHTLTESDSDDYYAPITPVVVFGFVQSTTAPRRLRSAGFLFAQNQGGRAC